MVLVPRQQGSHHHAGVQGAGCLGTYYTIERASRRGEVTLETMNRVLHDLGVDGMEQAEFAPLRAA
jgi:hypothetical protein